MTGSSTIIPFQSAPQPKATTAVQSCLPRSAVVANQFTSSRGGVESFRHAKAGNMTGAAPVAEKSSPATRPVRVTVQGAALQPCAGVAPGPREALSDPIAFNAALQGARDQTAAGASRQSGRALDAGRGVYPKLMLSGVQRDGFALGLNFYSLPSCPESSSRYRLRKAEHDRHDR